VPGTPKADVPRAEAMSAGIEITQAQARALVVLTDRVGPLAIRQLAAGEGFHPSDLYATPRGSASGYRVAADGSVSEIGETLPAPD
jgi:hypothetical protein